MIRAVIFDFNGVLLDDESVHFDLFREVLAEQGVDLTDRMYHERYLGYDDRQCLDTALRDAGRSPSTEFVESMIADKADRYLVRAEQGLRYFPNAAEALSGLAARWPVAINSGALRQEIVLTLRNMGVIGQVSAIVAAEDSTNGKPDPEGYLLALDALRSTVGEDIEAAHCLVFEDSLAGIQSAKGAGMWAVGVSNTYDEPALRAAGADAVIPGLESLTPEWVEKMFAPEVSP